MVVLAVLAVPPDNEGKCAAEQAGLQIIVLALGLFVHSDGHLASVRSGLPVVLTL